MWEAQLMLLFNCFIFLVHFDFTEENILNQTTDRCYSLFSLNHSDAQIHVSVMILFYIITISVTIVIDDIT